VVFWNVSQEEQNNILGILNKHSEIFYSQEVSTYKTETNEIPYLIFNCSSHKVINEESEYLSYSTINDEETDANKLETRLDKNHIYFKKYNPSEIYEKENHLLEKYDDQFLYINKDAKQT